MRDFVPQSVGASVKRRTGKRDILILTARETESVAKAILAPPSPGPVLRKAAREYRKKFRGRKQGPDKV